MRSPVFTIESGRTLCMDGAPMLVMRPDGNTRPYDADSMAKVIARVLNARPIEVGDVVWIRSNPHDGWSGPADVIEVAAWNGRPTEYLVRSLVDKEIWFTGARLL